MGKKPFIPNIPIHGLPFQPYISGEDLTDRLVQAMQSVPAVRQAVVDVIGAALLQQSAHPSLPSATMDDDPDDTPPPRPMAPAGAARPAAPLLDDRWCTLLQRVRADAELADLLLTGDDSDAVVRVLARCVHWPMLQRLWEKITERCQKEGRPISDDERHILRDALAAHNLLWDGQRVASAPEVSPGVRYDGKQHRRATPTGEQIVACWCPGLCNVAGVLVLKPLVQTQ